MSLRLMQPSEARTLTPKEQAAVRALEWHVGFRCEQDRFAPVEWEEDGSACTIITEGWMQHALRMSGSRWTGEHFAADCLREILPGLGLIEDTGRVELPRIPAKVQAQRSHFGGSTRTEGGVSAQADRQHSAWYRVFRLLSVPKLKRCLGAVWFSRSDRSRFSKASLSALARCQALMQPPKRRRSFSPGSVQWVFQNTGPP